MSPSCFFSGLNLLLERELIVLVRGLTVGGFAPGPMLLENAEGAGMPDETGRPPLSSVVLRLGVAAKVESSLSAASLRVSLILVLTRWPRARFPLILERGRLDNVRFELAAVPDE